MAGTARRFASLCIAGCALLLAACETTTEINGKPAANEATLATPSAAELRKRADIRLQLATNYYQQGQLPVALQEVQRALELDSSYADAHNLLGLINMNLGKTAEAESSFQRAMQFDGNNGEVINNYGWFLCQNGRERQSIEYFRRAAATKTYRTPAMAMQNAGICMLRLREDKSAEEFFRRAFELDASAPVARFQLARLYLASRQMEKARFYYGLLPKGQDANAELLWLGVRLAHVDGDSRTEQQLASDLRRRFPDSREAGALRREAFDE